MRLTSFKKLQALHQSLGGNKKGFYIIRFGCDYQTGKPISVIDRIAWHSKPSANWSSTLVKGRLVKR